MTKLKSLFGAIIISSILLISSCSGDKNANTAKNSPEFNMIAGIENPTVLFSINVMDLLKKSNLKESNEVPMQFKMIVNSQIDQHLNSENQGVKLEGNIPFVISSTNEGDFNYLMTTLEVIDAEKLGASLCLYFRGQVEKEGNISMLKASVTGLTQTGYFVWDNKTLVGVLDEKGNAKSTALAILANKNIDAKENENITSFLANKNDFSSTLFMEPYTKMVNKVSETTTDKALMESYKNMIATGNANFKDGEFVFETELKGDNFITSNFNYINTNAVDATFNDYLTETGQLILYGSGSINIKNLLNLIDHTSTQYDSYEEELTKIGIKKDELTQLFNGEFSFSLMDVENVPVDDVTEERPKFLLTGGTNDGEKVKSILTANPKAKVINNYFLIDDTYVGVFENKFFVSLNEALIQRLANGEKLTAYKTETNNPLFGKIITDMDALPENFKTSVLKNGGEEVLKFYNEVDDIQFSGNINKTKFSIVLNDKSKNSCEVLMNALLKNILPLVMGMV